MDMEGWEDRGLRVYSPQRSEAKAKGVLLRKWVQDGSPLFQHSHHSAFPAPMHVDLHTLFCLTFCTVRAMGAISCNISGTIFLMT